ncbi:UNVERIFIED_CONTAM: hypothetical protein HDU68_005823 [Siphonaria sp. JEL0065]|nr:hypothetical protein HDU68_005823 [Siphonaria sp. JEL0065]
MPPKRQVVAANERKAAQEDAKNAAALRQKEAEEAEKWNKGAKANKKEDEERKKQEAAAKKAEREAQLAAEEAEFSKKKPVAQKGGANKAAPTMASMVQKMAMGMSSAATNADGTPAVDTYGASGIDAALELLDLTTGKKVPANQAIDKHPERRMKSAWAVFEEREMPKLKEENPTLRLSQLKQLLQKKWKKSPENPLNAENAGSYDMTAQEVRDAVEAKRIENLGKFEV